MFDVFRFVALRQPDKVESVISIEGHGHLYQSLLNARSGNKAPVRMKELAAKFLQENKFKDKLPLTKAKQLQKLYSAIVKNQEADLQKLRELIEDIFKADPATILKSNSFQKDLRTLEDLIIANKIANSQITNAATAVNLSLYIRLVDLIKRVAAEDTTLNEKGAVSEALGRIIGLPSELFPLPLSDEKQKEKEHNKKIEEHSKRILEEKQSRYETLKEAYDMITSLSPRDFTTSVVRRPQSALMPSEILRLPKANENSELNENSNNIDKSPKSSNKGNSQRTLISEFVELKLKLSSDTIKHISPAVKRLFSDLKLDLETTPLSTMIDRINSELIKIRSEITTTDYTLSSKFVIVGDRAYLKDDIPAFGNGSSVGSVGTGTGPPATETGEVGYSHGIVKPVGIGDLLVVKQQVIGYEQGEVAYIENVLKGELNKREVFRAETTEITTTTEKESITEEERDLQSTDRFELQRGAESIITLDGRLQSGNIQSPSYGPVLQFQNSDENPLQGSQKVAEREASTYSREVTERATTKITERIRTQVIQKTIHTFHEKSEHTLDNREGATNTVGIYQWVDKVFQAQVFNYGKRLFFDIMVPEPGAFFLQSIYENGDVDIIKPEPFTLSPFQIDESNVTSSTYYENLMAKYGATPIEPPPPISIIISKGTKDVSDTGQISNLYEIKIPRDYQAESISSLTYMAIAWKDSTISFLLGTAGLQDMRRAPIDPDAAKLKGETDTIPLSVRGIDGVFALMLHIELSCKRTDEAKKNWQSRTYGAILQAHNKRFSEYEERLANLQAALRIGAVGLSSEKKREVEKTELKKSCISILTYQQYDTFNGITISRQTDPNDSSRVVPYPEINFTAAENQGRYIRFFEQAFEWEQMVYRFYPYFWGRKNEWMKKLMIEDKDTQFQDFLKAGAARVTVPVRRGFEKAVAHFMDTGNILEDTDPGDIADSPTYVPIINELTEYYKKPHREEPYGKPWIVKLPTTLVKVGINEKLPKWKEQSGKWVLENGRE